MLSLNQPHSASSYCSRRGTAPNDLIRQQQKMLRPKLSLNQNTAKRRRSALLFSLIDQDGNRSERKSGGLLSGTSRLNLPWRQSRNSRASDNSQMFFTNNFIQGRFTTSDPPSDDGSASATQLLITKLDKYTPEELKEYRQVFNMFDAGKNYKLIKI